MPFHDSGCHLLKSVSWSLLHNIHHCSAHAQSLMVWKASSFLLTRPKGQEPSTASDSPASDHPFYKISAVLPKGTILHKELPGQSRWNVQDGKISTFVYSVVSGMQRWRLDECLQGESIWFTNFAPTTEFLAFSPTLVKLKRLCQDIAQYSSGSWRNGWSET